MRLSSFRLPGALACVALLSLASCSDQDSPAHEPATEPAHESASTTHAHPSDHHDPKTWGDIPDWARRTAELHGGLGPWAIAGAIAGRDGSAKLKTSHPAATINVVYSLAPDQQAAGYMCVLDGLQVGAGVSMGKQTVKLQHRPDLERADAPTEHASTPAPIFILAQSPNHSTLAALRYTPTPKLLGVLFEGSMDSLADDARRLISMPVEELFFVETIENPAVFDGEPQLSPSPQMLNSRPNGT
ncbi:MAG: hypothetical protein SFZ23_15355 [Planctomycetota bacterium]|nr:hypothetical protein [Planctomycetota bacterium]